MSQNRSIQQARFERNNPCDRYGSTKYQRKWGDPRAVRRAWRVLAKDSEHFRRDYLKDARNG
ncbi:hypothetical protein SMA75_20100 [Escherichia coli]|uniref:hypothetical protein n=1 Tax=Escherichia coli TaxID=562 RepID=UPI003079A656